MLQDQLMVNPYEIILERINSLEFNLLSYINKPTGTLEQKPETYLKTRQQTLDILSISDPTLNRHVAKGRLIKTYFGRKVYYDLSEFIKK